jgi:hypothetical protein
MNTIADCPPDLPPELQEPLRKFAHAWVLSSLRPRPELQILAHWDSLISTWANAPDLPLFIRKVSAGRGQYLTHPSGRILIPVDNSPAHWSYIHALQNVKLGIADIRKLLAADEIPVAMILKKEEKEKARLLCNRSKWSLNKAGWKLGHIAPVGLNERTPLTEMPLENLKAHFTKLMSPSNMFLVPLSLAGLAEMPVMLEEIKALRLI